MTYGVSTGPTVYRGDIAPTTGRLGDLWVDTSIGFPIVSICTAISPLTWIALGGMRPISRTTYTSGSGNYTAVVGDWLRVTIQAGGGAGGGTSGSANRYASGGGGGESRVFWMRAQATSLPYSVGAAGTASAGAAGGNGGDTSFNGVYVMGGKGGGADIGAGVRAPGYGGGLSWVDNVLDTEGTVSVPFMSTGEGVIHGGSGGYGNSSASLAKYAGNPDYGQLSGNYGGSMSGKGGSGGCSRFGLGGIGVGTNGAGAAGTGYGAGGAGACTASGSVSYAGGAGTAGVIHVENFGNW